MVECWRDNRCYGKMLKAARKKRLETAKHWPALRQLLDLARGRRRTWLMDVGCGAGALLNIASVREQFNYTGVDMPQIIDQVVHLFHTPDRWAHFIWKEIVPGVPMMHLSAYNIVVLNAFIDVAARPLEMLDTILGSCTGDVILHRQLVTDGPTQISTSKSYGGRTYCTVLNRGDLCRLLRRHRLEILEEIPSGIGKGYTSFYLGME